MSEASERTGAPAGRVRWTLHREVRMLVTDFSGAADPARLRALAEQGHEAVRGCAPESVLALALFSGVPYTLENLEIVRDLAARNRPYVRARAVVGIPPIAALSVGPFARLTGRPLRAFASTEEAKDWAEVARA